MKKKARQNAVEFYRSNHLVDEWQCHLTNAFDTAGDFTPIAIRLVNLTGL